MCSTRHYQYSGINGAVVILEVALNKSPNFHYSCRNLLEAKALLFRNIELQSTRCMTLSVFGSTKLMGGEMIQTPNSTTAMYSQCKWKLTQLTASGMLHWKSYIPLCKQLLLHSSQQKGAHKMLLVKDASALAC